MVYSRTKPPHHIQTRCSSLRQALVPWVPNSSLCSTAVLLQGSPNSIFSYEDTDWPEFLTCRKGMQLATLLATMLIVNFGITNLDIPWISPMITPRELKEIIISRILKRKQCLKCLLLQVLMALINAWLWCSQRKEHSYWANLGTEVLTELFLTVAKGMRLGRGKKSWHANPYNILLTKIHTAHALITQKFLYPYLHHMRLSSTVLWDSSKQKSV